MSATPQFTLSRQVKVKETELKEKEAKVRDHFEKLTAIVNRDERALDDDAPGEHAFARPQFRHAALGPLRRNRALLIARVPCRA